MPKSETTARFFGTQALREMLGGIGPGTLRGVRRRNKDFPRPLKLGIGKSAKLLWDRFRWTPSR
jgi:hypothetical protein